MSISYSGHSQAQPAETLSKFGSLQLIKYVYGHFPFVVCDLDETFILLKLNYGLLKRNESLPQPGMKALGFHEDVLVPEKKCRMPFASNVKISISKSGFEIWF